MLEWAGQVYLERAQAFGWNAVEIDGHDVGEIDRAYREGQPPEGPPISFSGSPAAA